MTRLCTRNRFCYLLLTAVLCQTAACPALAVDFIWDLDGDGNWSTMGNWDQPGIPGASDDVFIRNVTTPTNPVVVTVESNVTRDVQNVTIDANGANPHELSVSNNTFFDIHGNVVNNGIISLNSTGNTTLLRADGASPVLSGTGRMVLGAGGPNGLSATGNQLWTNSAGHTIEGAGNVGQNSAAVLNEGLIDANVNGGTLALDPRNNGGGVVTFTNNATARASGGGTLVLSGTGFGEFGGTGTYEALAGSEVVIANATVRNSTFSTAGDGLVRTGDGQNTAFVDITNTGQFQIGDNTDARMHGTITNSGDITFASTGNPADFELGANVTLTGGGTVTLNDPLARIDAVGNFTLTNVDNTLQGTGQIGSNLAVVVNNSLVDANVPGETLTLDPRANGGGVVTFTNNATARASGGGTLVLSGAGFGEFGGTGTYEALAGSEVVIANATVHNSTFSTAGDGLVRTGDGQNTAFVDITNTGQFQIGNNTDARMHGTITNSGDITFASTGNPADFELGANVTLTGGGTVTLNDPLARIDAVGNFTLTNVDNTLQGTGQIGSNLAVVVNNSLVDANVPGETLTLDPRANGGGVVTFTNNATARASGGGTLVLSGAGFGEFGGTGTYEALAGSEVVIANATVHNSTFSTSGDGLVRTGDGQNTAFVDITNTGQFQIGNGTDARMHGTITNSGEITFASTSNATDFELGANVTLTGGGTVTFNDPLARIDAVGNFTLTNVDNTLQGTGQIGSNTTVIVNQGTIDAAGSTSVLTIDPRNNGGGVATFHNEGTGRVRARTGGTVILTGGGGGQFANGTGGRFLIESTVQLVSGAVFNNNPGGRVEGDGVLDIVSGTFTNGGFVAPGLSAGTLTVQGTYNQSSTGTLEIEVGGPTPGTDHDQLVVTGTANLDGTLDVTTIGAQADPLTRGTVDEFVVLTAASVSGFFSDTNYDGDALVPLGGLGGDGAFVAFVGDNGAGDDGLFRGLEYGDTEVTLFNYLALEGDANGDRTVDGQDFIIWNANKFTAGTDWTTGDFTGDGVTDGQDFIVWNANKFTSVDAAASVVPEPNAVLLALVAGLVALATRRRR